MKPLESTIRENTEHSPISIHMYIKSHNKNLFSTFPISEYIIVSFQQQQNHKVCETQE